MQIEYHSRLQTEFYVNSNKGRRWQLTHPFEFSVDDKRFVAPAGFWTDFASVPRLIWPIISPYDLGVGPVPHDFGYFTGYRSKSYWDKVFAACMEKDRISQWRRVAAYQAVHLLGGRVWRNYRSAKPELQLHTIIVTRKMELIGWDRARRIGKASKAVYSAKEYMWKGQIETLTLQQS